VERERKHDAAVAAQPKNIVVGFDGSQGARRALDAAAHLIGYGSTLTVVSVFRDGESAAPDALAEAREWLLDRLVTATYLRRAGDAADELVAAATELDADLLVVGRRSADGEPAPGSVSAEVVRRAVCDVLVVG
jgi:nucleotide-binding universal stress UspA family protein